MQISRPKESINNIPYWVVRKTSTGIYYRQPFIDKKEFKRISKCCKDEIIARGLNDEESEKLLYSSNSYSSASKSTLAS